MNNKVYIGNLSISTTEKQIVEIFSKFGKVISFEITKAMDGKSSSGHGYIIMDKENETSLAVQKMNNTNIDGNIVRVVLAHPMDVFRRESFRNNRSFRSGR